MKTVVLGGGPGGYVCAIRLAQLGAEVTLVEAAELGGVCLNAGCIPTKALLHVAELYRNSKKSAGYGIVHENTSIDWQAALAYKNRVIRKLVTGVASLVKANAITLVKGSGVFSGQNEVTVTGQDGTKLIAFDKAVIAVGSKPKIPPITGASLEGVVTSTEALAFPGLPKSLAIIGGGVIGCEFAELYASLGVQVTVIETLPDILATLDKDLVKVCKRSLASRGVKIYPDATVREITRTNGTLAVSFNIKTDAAAGADRSAGANGPADAGGAAHTVEVEKVLAATGRSPNTESIGLDRIGLQTERGFIPVDPKTMRTELQHIYAIGDCVNTPQLAHVASAEGESAAAAIMGRDAGIYLDAAPSCVYLSPELASVGLSEEQAEQRGLEYSTGLFPMLANGRSSLLDEKLGLAKIIAEKKSGKILGVHLACSSATEIISQAALAIRLNATAEQLITTIAAHPTVHEALREAALALSGEAIHLP
jgi:dihydrolipoamide dehydrogenase